MGGLMGVTGEPGVRRCEPASPSPIPAAGVFAATGILIALAERERSGIGQWVHTSLLQAQIAMMDFQAARYLIEGKVPPQAGNDHPTSTPMGVVATADGFINIGVGGDGQWRAFCKVIGRPELAAHPDFAKGADRTRNRPQIKALITPIFAAHTSAEWLERLEAEGVPAGPFYRVDEVFADPQVQHLGIAVPLKDSERGECRVVGQPIVMSRTPASVVPASRSKANIPRTSSRNSAIPIPKSCGSATEKLFEDGPCLFLTADDGVNLHYEEVGTGTPIVFVHEFAGDCRSWGAQMRYFGRRYRCIAFNARGYPPSDVPEIRRSIRRSAPATTSKPCSMHSSSTRRISSACRWAVSRRCTSALPIPSGRCRWSSPAAAMALPPTSGPQFTAETKRAAALIRAMAWTRPPKAMRLLHRACSSRTRTRGAGASSPTNSPSNSTRGSALTMRGVQARRPSLFDLVEQMKRSRRRPWSCPATRTGRAWSPAS